MKVLIAIVSCHIHSAYRDAVRKTWLPLVRGADAFFFCGRGADQKPLSDEVFLDCEDKYSGLPNKVQEIIRWALVHGYDFVVKIDNDTVLLPDRFLASDFTRFDFTGNNNWDNGKIVVPWGFCYTLSKRAMRLIENAPLPNNNNDEMWVAHTLFANEIVLHRNLGYHLHLGKKSDFVEPPPGWNDPSKRRVKRPDLTNYEINYAAFAHCMYIHWLGFRSPAMTDDKVIRELKRVFELTKDSLDEPS